jgi:hypothetical protein
MKNMKNMICELNDERFTVIDKIVNEDDVINYLNSIEKIQSELLNNNIDAKEMYEYLYTLMINNC